MFILCIRNDHAINSMQRPCIRITCTAAFVRLCVLLYAMVIASVCWSCNATPENVVEKHERTYSRARARHCKNKNNNINLTRLPIKLRNDQAKVRASHVRLFSHLPLRLRPIPICRRKWPLLLLPPKL